MRANTESDGEFRSVGKWSVLFVYCCFPIYDAVHCGRGASFSKVDTGSIFRVEYRGRIER